MVFSNQPAHPSGAVRHEGKAAGGETLAIDPARLPLAVDRVVIGGSTDGGTFGSVPGLHVAVLDAASGAEIARFQVGDAASETALLFAEVYRRGAGWKLRAVGQGYASGLAGFAQDFGVAVAEDEPARTVPPGPPGPPGGPAAAGLNTRRWGVAAGPTGRSRPATRSPRAKPPAGRRVRLRGWRVRSARRRNPPGSTHQEGKRRRQCCPTV
jgi:TerD domain-containing protein